MQKRLMRDILAPLNYLGLLVGMCLESKQFASETICTDVGLMRDLELTRAVYNVRCVPPQPNLSSACVRTSSNNTHNTNRKIF